MYTRVEQYTAMTKLFESRFLARAYPKPLIQKTKSGLLYSVLAKARKRGAPPLYEIQ